MSTGAIRAYAKPRRKCSFRFMLVDGHELHVVTQDARRRRKCVTGITTLPNWGSEHHQNVARSEGCSVIIRVKTANRRRNFIDE